MSKSKKKKHPDAIKRNNKPPVLSPPNKVNDKEQVKENGDEPETITNMEIYHPHGHHPKRGFKDYIFEFIMIFVAITGGFFMENIREHVVDRHKEKEYVVRLVRDLKEDTASLKLVMRQNLKQMNMLDSLVIMLEKPTPTIDLKIISLLAEYLNDYHLFKPRDITMSQLRNTGGFRLIENSNVSDNIVSYYSYIEYINLGLGNANAKFVEESFKEEMGFINFNQIVNIQNLKITDVNKMNLANRCFVYKIQIRSYYNCLKEIDEQGASLLKYLKDEYNLTQINQ